MASRVCPGQVAELVFCVGCLPATVSLEIDPTANLRATILDFGGSDSGRILTLRGGILMSVGNFPESLSQAILVGRLAVFVKPPEPELSAECKKGNRSCRCGVNSLTTSDVRRVFCCANP